MPQLMTTPLKSGTLVRSKVQPVLPNQDMLKALLYQLESGDHRHPYFDLAQPLLIEGHIMRAIKDCCRPFHFLPRVSRCGRYLKFDVGIHCPSSQSVELMTRTTRMLLFARCAFLPQSLVRSLSKTRGTVLANPTSTFDTTQWECMTSCTGLCSRSERIKRDRPNLNASVHDVPA